MAIKKNLAGTPSRGEGVPLSEPRYVTAIAEAWHRAYLEAGKDTRAMASETPFRGSDAGSCSYDLGLKLLIRAGFGEQSDPPSLADTWRLNIGSMVHAALEEHLPAAFPGAACEVVGVTVEGEASFHADVLIIHDDGTKTLVELKTINGLGFKSATIGFRGPAEGPRENAILQAALAAEAYDCDEVVIGYLALENISVAEAKRHEVTEVGRFAAEWTFTREQYLPLAQAERARFRWIKALVDNGMMPDRTIPSLPEGAVVTDPGSGSWSVSDPANPLTVTDIGTTWHCSYCWNRTACRSLLGG